MCSFSFSVEMSRTRGNGRSKVLLRRLGRLTVEGAKNRARRTRGSRPSWDRFWVVTDPTSPPSHYSACLAASCYGVHLQALLPNIPCEASLQSPHCRFRDFLRVRYSCLGVRVAIATANGTTVSSGMLRSLQLSRINCSFRRAASSFLILPYT